MSLGFAVLRRFWGYTVGLRANANFLRVIREQRKRGKKIMVAVKETIDQVAALNPTAYRYGFATEVDVDKAPPGLSEDIIRLISAKKGEPAWMLEWRLGAYRRWLTLKEPTWARVHYPPIAYNELCYFSAPKSNPAPKSLDEIDPAIRATYQKLGIPLHEQEILAGIDPSSRVAVDAVFDSVSVATTFKEELKKAGVLFCS